MKITQDTIELAKRNGIIDYVYGELVSAKIRKKYSTNAELAVLRQRDTKPEEFEAYNAYVEQCKVEAKAELGIEYPRRD